MKKIPAVFVRDMTVPRAPYTRDVTPGCEWVLAGEGTATRKWDGTACAIINGKLYARYDAKRGKEPPAGAIACQEPDPETGHWPHWVEVTDPPQPQFRWMHEAFTASGFDAADGTYEAIGPKIGSNHERVPEHRLERHGNIELVESAEERTYNYLKAHLENCAYEGFVFHHEDGRMAKVTRQGFGLAWPMLAREDVT